MKTGSKLCLLALALSVALFGCSEKGQENNESLSGEEISSSMKEYSGAEFVSYLYDNLSKNDYSNIEMADNNNIIIYCTDKAAVKDFINNMDAKIPEIKYLDASYSFAELNPIIEEISGTDVILNNSDKIDIIKITDKGIEILLNTSENAEELFKWYSGYENNSKVFFMDKQNNKLIDSSTLKENDKSGTGSQGATINNKNPEEKNPQKPAYSGENDTLKQYLKNVLSKASYAILKQEGDVLFIECPIEQEQYIKSAISNYKGTDKSTPVLLQNYYTAANYAPIKKTVDAKVKEFGIEEYTTTYIDANGVKVLINAACDTAPFIKWCSEYDQRKSVWVELLYLN